jgi:arsenite-transporting ATPase
MTGVGAKRVTMFAGKGGVGKTTCAGATALHHAGHGHALAISTDPTPSLAHIFETTGSGQPVPVCDGLLFAELGMEAVRQAWEKKFGRELHQVFSSVVAVDYDEFNEFISSILPGLYDEFIIDHIRNLSETGDYHQIVWDTAPLGQTLGLLQTPAMLLEHLKPAPRIYSRLKLGRETRKSVMDIIKGWEALSAADIEFLRNDVGFVVVTIAEALAVEQLDGLFADFERFGLAIERLVVNNVVTAPGDSEFLRSKAEQQQGYLDRLYAKFAGTPIVQVPLFPHEIKGLDRLRLVEGFLYA